MKAILTYHSIDSSGSVISTSETVFRRHVAWLASGIVRVVSIPELLTLGDDVDAVALTFDDGFANFAEVAAPVLSECGLTATVFVATDFVGGTNSWEFQSGASVPLLPLMDWHRISALHEGGHAVGGHTRTHANLARLSGAELTEEIGGCAERIRTELGVIPDSFAYPFGVASPEAVDEVSSTFAYGCTTEFRPVAAGDAVHTLPRLDMYYFRRAGRLESFGTPGFARYVAARNRARRIKQSIATALKKTNG